LATHPLIYIIGWYNLFVELPEFIQAWDQMGLDVEDDLLALQLLMMAAPKKARVIPGAGGLRKMRFAPASWNVGSSGAARVCYVSFENFGIVLWVIAYSKSETDDLSDAGKVTIRKVIAETRRYLKRGGMIT
jgi:hypothetical protein